MLFPGAAFDAASLKLGFIQDPDKTLVSCIPSAKVGKTQLTAAGLELMSLGSPLLQADHPATSSKILKSFFFFGSIFD